MPWYFPGGKHPGMDVGLSVPSSAGFKRIGAILLHPSLRLRDVDKAIYPFLPDRHSYYKEEMGLEQS